MGDARIDQVPKDLHQAFLQLEEELAKARYLLRADALLGGDGTHDLEELDTMRRRSEALRVRLAELDSGGTPPLSSVQGHQ